MKVIEELKGIAKGYEKRGSIGTAAAMTVVIERIEMNREYQELISKSKPLKVESLIGNGCYLKSGVCPKCKSHLENAYNNYYCGGCGQKLDWRGKE